MPDTKTPLETMKEALSRRLGKTIEDPLLVDVLADAITDVKNYCNLPEIPPELYSTVVRIAMDMWRGAGYGQETAPQQVTSVKRGDVQTSFATPGFTGANAAGGADYKAPYLPLLRDFRVLRK